MAASTREAVPMNRHQGEGEGEGEGEGRGEGRRMGQGEASCKGQPRKNLTSQDVSHITWRSLGVPDEVLDLDGEVLGRISRTGPASTALGVLPGAIPIG